MILQVCSIFDAAVGAYAAPFHSPTKAAAIRSFRDAVSREENLRKFATDYHLFFLAEFDDSKGSYITGSVPLRIASASEFIDDNVMPPRSAAPGT